MIEFVAVVLTALGWVLTGAAGMCAEEAKHVDGERVQRCAGGATAGAIAGAILLAVGLLLVRTA